MNSRVASVETDRFRREAGAAAQTIPRSDVPEVAGGDRLRINLFTNGDCTDINTWSNLPHSFYKALLTRNVSVRPIDLAPTDVMSYRALSRLMDYRARVCNPEYRCEMFRTRAYHLFTNRRLRAVARRHLDADLNLFLTATFSSYRYVDVPVVHYCDRTYEHYLEETGDKPTWNDRVFIQIDRRNLENADLVLTTNQLCCEFIKSRYKAKRVLHLKAGINADIDGLDLSGLDPDDLTARKENSKDILFIGRGVYRRGVDILVKAFKIFNERREGEFTLHIVGVKPQELPKELQQADPKIRFYAYLDRNVQGERDLYQNLLRSAKMFVFPMRPSPEAGVLSEAQFYCTPIIVSNFSDAVRHGHDGIVVDHLEPVEFAHQMEGLVDDISRWRQMARNAHESIRSYTWDRTIENFLNIVSEIGLVAPVPSCAGEYRGKSNKGG